MRKCRLCRSEATEVVSSYNHHAWMCDEHVDTFISLATHWMYQMHKAVPYNPLREEVSFMYDTDDDSPAPKSGVKKGKDYSYVPYDPEARGFARPRGKHLKVYPRWTGMSTHDADEKHGEVYRKKVAICDTVDDDPLTDMDYASKTIIWDSSNIYTKG